MSVKVRLILRIFWHLFDGCLLTVKEKAEFSDNFTSVLKCCMVLFHQNIFLVKNDTQEFLAVLACFSSPLTSQFQYGRGDYSGALKI